MPAKMQESHLKRTLSLPLVTFYGLGTIIGAGIYALIGAVTQQAKLYTPFSFLIAAIIALFTAASYAELSSRFPQSAGAALYVKKAFNKVWLSSIIGWLVVATGLVSAATLCHGFVNYLQLFFPISSFVAIPLLVFTLGGIAILGITESAISIMILTIVEVVGLLIVVWYGKNSFTHLLTNWQHYIPTLQLKAWSGIFSGAFLAFYAYIGFEDMVNLAEEVKNPKKILPLGIFLALFAATLLYLLISWVTITILPYQEFIKASLPLALIIERQGHSPFLFGLIALMAIANGVLVQIIMASRLIYGMARFKGAPKFFFHITKSTQVPLFAILFFLFAVIILAYAFPIAVLAKATSSIMLSVFALANLSLIVVKYQKPHFEAGISFPVWVPVIGFMLSISFLLLPIFI